MLWDDAPRQLISKLNEGKFAQESLLNIFF